MRSVLIDTNIYSLAMKGDPVVVKELRRIDRIGFTSISVGELCSGFKGGNRERRNREELNFSWIPHVFLYMTLMWIQQIFMPQS